MATQIPQDYTTPGIRGVMTDIFTQKTGSYQIVVNICIPEEENKITVEAANIHEMMWENKLNALWMQGRLIVRDQTGLLGKLTGSAMAKVEFLFREVTGSTEPASIKPTSNEFTHSFLINRIEQGPRDGNDVTYILHLIGETYFPMQRRLYWSNYDPSITIRKTNLIIQDLLTNALKDCAGKYDMCISGSGVFDESFTSYWQDAPEQSYATTVETTFQDAFDYLMHHALFIKETAAKTLHTIVYDAQKKQFRLLDLTDDNSFIEAANTGRAVGFNNPYEAVVLPLEQKFGSVNEMSNADYLDLFRERVMYDIDFELGITKGGPTKTDSATLNNKDISEQTNMSKWQTDSIMLMLDGSETWKSFRESLHADYEPSIGYTYYTVQSRWATDPKSQYAGLVDAVLYRDAMVLETYGTITHGPGMAFEIALADEETKGRHEDNLGGFLAVQTVHVVRPNALDGAKFTENITLAKLWQKKEG